MPCDPAIAWRPRWLRQDRAIRMQAVGIWAPGPRVLWWLAAYLELPIAELAGLYDQRMAIE